MIVDEDNYLAHYGILRRSGRYPWGSGKSPEERGRSFLGTVKDLKNQGLSETEIARGFGMTTSELRAARTIARSATKAADIAMAQRLSDKGYSNVAIGKRMGINESQVRALLKPGEMDKATVLKSTADVLREQVTKKGYIDVGSGVERHMAISETKLKAALAVLKSEGYEIHKVKIPQLGTNHETTVKVLSAPGTSYSEVIRNKDNIKQVMSYSENGGRSYDDIQPPMSISSKRVAVRYAEQGGTDADGVIYVRPGVKDVSLGGSHYAQVRIAVDGTHYIKGMAMYKDGLPAGVDLMFNTNKSNTGNKLDALKPLKNDPDNPFGAQISRQIGENIGGKKKLTSAMNIVNEEGDWEKWSKTLSSQMLSKQSHTLAKQQLDMAYERKLNEFEAIKSAENPAVKRRLLQSFSDDADSSAVHLKAAALPRQGSHVILPINSMKETEVYAPNFKNGERVVLVRFPHGGIFEIPELTVNNRHPEAKKLLGNARDAIGIHSKVAERLSGADFDGDTVLVIPNRNKSIKTAPALEGLKDFDPKRAYPHYEGMKVMDARTRGIQMGLVSNLITDMTIKGATNDELAAAVRHSMVVIDAEKHKLNYRQSAIDNRISALQSKYQGRAGGRADTLISKSGVRATTAIPERKERPVSQGGPIDKTTGKKVYVETGRSYVDRLTGKTVYNTVKVPRLSIVDDAHTESSGTPIEKIYADHSNRMKELANQARLEMIRTKPIAYSPEARKIYAKEVRSLEGKLHLALRNSPLERQAQIIANAQVALKRRANPDMDAAELKKVKAKALTDARIRTGAKKQLVSITPEEWRAIQAGAITNKKLTDILANADLDKVKELATPKTREKLSTDKVNRAVAMLRNGYTQAEVAEQLGVSVSTLKRSLAGGEE